MRYHCLKNCAESDAGNHWPCGLGLGEGVQQAPPPVKADGSLGSGWFESVTEGADLHSVLTIYKILCTVAGSPQKSPWCSDSERMPHRMLDGESTTESARLSIHFF